MPHEKFPSRKHPVKKLNNSRLDFKFVLDSEQRQVAKSSELRFWFYFLFLLSFLYSWLLLSPPPPSPHRTFFEHQLPNSKNSETCERRKATVEMRTRKNVKEMRGRGGGGEKRRNKKRGENRQKGESLQDFCLKSSLRLNVGKSESLSESQ